MQRTIARMFRCAGLALAIIGAPGAASAWASAPAAVGAFASAEPATVTLKDGRVLTGVIEREIDGYLWLRAKVGNIEQQFTLRPEDIAKIERSAPAAADAPADPVSPAAPSTPAVNTGAPRALVLTLGEVPDRDMVGMYTAAKPLLDAIPTLEEELGTDGSGVVVLRVRSYGGMLIEVNRLHDVILDQLKPRFRTVGWIEIAISAGAATSHVMPELYFTTEGIYGASTAFNGGTGQALEGRGLETFLFYMERASARGGRPYEIFRSMQIPDALSCTIDENGEVQWYQDATSGQMLVNPAGKVLTFNSADAVRYKFARAIADDLPTLTTAMGYQELNWVGRREPEMDWPISRSEEIQMRYRKRVFDDEKRTLAYQVDYGGAIQAAEGAADRETRARFVGRARTALGNIKSMVRNNPNFALMIFNQLPEEWPEWVEAQEKQLRDLLR